MKRLTLIAACLLMAALGAHAGDVPAAGEHLIVAPYPAQTPWKRITDQRNDKMWMIEWIPADQDEADIQDILTEQVFYIMKGRDPSSFAGDLLKRIAAQCARTRVNGPKAGNENGFTVAYAQVYCTNQIGAGKDVDIFIKAIAGQDALYVVQREFRRPAQPGATPGVTTFSADQLSAMTARITAQAAANRFLVDQVQLCPPSGGTGICAPGIAPK